MKVTILCQNNEILGRVKSGLAQVGGVEITSESLVLAQFASQDMAPPPDLLVIHAPHGSEDLQSISSLISRHPRLPIIVVSADGSADFLLQAMHIGVREVMPESFTDAALTDALDRISRHIAREQEASGRILAFIPSKGGSGSTFLTTNLGYALAEEGKRVILIDLHMQFGDATLYVSNQNVQTTVAEVAHQIMRLDGEFLRSSLLKVTPNFGILAAPESPDKAIGIRPENIERILNLARISYDYVLLDLGMNLDPVSVRALDNSDKIYMVVQLTLPFIRGAMRLINAFDSLGYSRNKVSLLVNRHQPGGDIGLSDVEKTLGLRVAHAIPNSFAAVANAINQGMPILKLNPGDRVAKMLQDIAAEMIQKPRPRGLLSRWFGHARTS